MDKMVMKNLFGGIYYGKKVFLTGHTGFKGSWLALWLTNMGAIVKGYSLAPNTNPTHWELLGQNMESVYCDIRDKERLEQELISFNPEIVFHLAAQPIVRLSYENPFETYDVNVMGTLTLFEACRKIRELKAIINITTDKCYENKEWVWGYRENDPLGGYDPYSSSKACAELLTTSFRRSFFNILDYGNKHNTLLTSARAGNVIGGGDWAQDRLIPDIMKTAAINQKTIIRNPDAIRPWQHVLEPLSGYLILGQYLLNGHRDFADSWNFGPIDECNINVKEVAEMLKKNWNNISIEYEKNQQLHEATLLKLDCSKAISLLGWRPVWDSHYAIKRTVDWYKEYYENNVLLTESDLNTYIKDAKEKNIVWTI